MGIQILLRKDIGDNPFRRALGKLMSMEGEELILGSGYASKYLFNKYNSKDFGDKIIEGFKNASNPKIIIIGGMFQKKTKDPKTGSYISSVDTTDFQGFIDELQKYLAGTKIKIEIHRAKSDLWHSKIAIKRRSENEPIACIVGSSNLTVPAFSENYKGFNYEADVYFTLRGLRGGIRNIKHEVKDLKNERNELIDEFIQVLKEKQRNFKKEQIKELCGSSQGMISIKDTALEVFKADNDENKRILELVFLLMEYNNLIESAGENKTVLGSSVISVRANRIEESKVITELNTSINNALSVLTVKKTGLTL